MRILVPLLLCGCFGAVEPEFPDPDAAPDATIRADAGLDTPGAMPGDSTLPWYGLPCEMNCPPLPHRNR